MNVTQAVLNRRSVRAFLDKPVPRAMIEEILDIARRSPSGSNVQPWQVYVTMGEDHKRFLEKIRKALAENPMGEGDSYQLYPNPLPEPYNSRRRKVAKDMYAQVGIDYGDKTARLMQMAKNYEFFGAPVGMFFTIHESLGLPQWAHLGMFIQTIMLLAQERGLGSCPQEAWYNRPKTIAQHFNIPGDQKLYCGMALGYVDESHAINGLVTEREAVEHFTQIQA